MAVSTTDLKGPWRLLCQGCVQHLQQGPELAGRGHPVRPEEQADPLQQPTRNKQTSREGTLLIVSSASGSVVAWRRQVCACEGQATTSCQQHEHEMGEPNTDKPLPARTSHKADNSKDARNACTWVCRDRGFSRQAWVGGLGGLALSEQRAPTLPRRTVVGTSLPALSTSVSPRKCTTEDDVGALAETSPPLTAPPAASVLRGAPRGGVVSHTAYKRDGWPKNKAGDGNGWCASSTAATQVTIHATGPNATRNTNIYHTMPSWCVWREGAWAEPCEAC